MSVAVAANPQATATDFPYLSGLFYDNVVFIKETDSLLVVENGCRHRARGRSKLGVPVHPSRSSSSKRIGEWIGI